MFFPKATELAHQLIAECLKKRNSAIDATAGNGHDTQFLAEVVGAGGKVFAFDLQEVAIESTRQRLASSEVAKVVEYICGDHANMAELVPTGKHGKIKAIMFNLGYLPGGDKGVTTRWPSTIKAIRAGLNLLSPEGVMTIVVYPAHPSGQQESIALDKFVSQLDPNQLVVVRYGIVNSNKQPPYLIAIRHAQKAGDA